LFLAASTSGAFLGLTQGVGKGKGRASPLWTKWRNVDPTGRNDEWSNNEWKGGEYMWMRERDHATKINVSHEIPSLK